MSENRRYYIQREEEEEGAVMDQTDSLMVLILQLRRTSCRYSAVILTLDQSLTSDPLILPPATLNPPSHLTPAPQSPAPSDVKPPQN